jgi:hypothetical protein
MELFSDVNDSNHNSKCSHYIIDCPGSKHIHTAPRDVDAKHSGQ